MEPARQDSEHLSQVGAKRNAAHKREWDDPTAGPKTRRVEEAPGLAVVATPIVGLLIWGGLIALVF